jgi:hypothetical protein
MTVPILFQCDIEDCEREATHRYENGFRFCDEHSKLWESYVKKELAEFEAEKRGGLKNDRFTMAIIPVSYKQIFRTDF